MNHEKIDLSLSLKSDSWLGGQMGYPVWCVQKNRDGEKFSLLLSGNPIFSYVKVDTSDLPLLWSLTDFGFRVVDVALTFEGNQQIQRVDADVRFARAADKEPVGNIASKAFRYSRFHLDPFIPSSTANSIKSNWAMNYFAGKRGDAMIVAEEHGEVVGFTQLLWDASTLVIDLIAVGPQSQGKGIGKKMISCAFNQGVGRQPEKIRVGTQAANIASVRFYESLGFKLVGSQYILHYHSRGDEVKQ